MITREAKLDITQYFDLAPDEDQRLVLDMVERFAAQHLASIHPVGAETENAFAQLGLTKILVNFSDPILTAMICERFGARCVLTGLRLILPHLLFTAGQSDGLTNLAIAHREGDQVEVMGLAFAPYQPIMVLFDHGSVLRIEWDDIANLEQAQPVVSLQGCQIINGHMPYKPLRGVNLSGVDASECANRLVLVLLALLLGGIGRALEFGFDYAQHRKAFGKAIIGHQPVAFRLVDGMLKFNALRLLILNEAALFPEGRGVKSLVEETISASAVVLRDVMQNCGGHGYITGIEINTLFQTNSLCRAMLSNLSRAFLTYPNLETN